jgi:hypothetical protein
MKTSLSYAKFKLNRRVAVDGSGSQFFSFDIPPCDWHQLMYNESLGGYVRG